MVWVRFYIGGLRDGGFHVFFGEVFLDEALHGMVEKTGFE